MPTANVAYLNVNQGLETVPFWWPHTPSFKCIDRLLEVLDEMQRPRIFGASEVSLREWNSRKNIFRIIAKEGGFAYSQYSGNFRFPEVLKVNHTSFAVGNALFSDLPLEDKVVGEFPSIVPLIKYWSATWGSRTFMINKVVHDKGSLYVVVAHLGLLFRSHRQSAARMLAKIGRRIDGPAILMLDANSPPVYVPDFRRYNYGSNLLNYLYFYLFDRKNLGDWIRDDHRMDRTVNVLEYGFPKDMCPVSCYKKIICDDENRPYKTFEDRIIDYVLGKNVPDSRYYHVVDEKISDHKMIMFELDLPDKHATCQNMEDLIVTPQETVPYEIVEAARSFPKTCHDMAEAVKNAGVYAKENCRTPLKKLAKRVASIL